MTDKEKIEKLLDHLEKYCWHADCDTQFANEERWDNRYDDEWCEKHCEWQCPHKECYRHYLLGERGNGMDKALTFIYRIFVLIGLIDIGHQLARIANELAK